MTEPIWEHGLTNGTDFNGMEITPDYLTENLGWWEREGVHITGIRASIGDAGWMDAAPEGFYLEYSAEIPKGCGYYLGPDREPIAFILDAVL